MNFIDRILKEAATVSLPAKTIIEKISTEFSPPDVKTKSVNKGEGVSIEINSNKFTTISRIISKMKIMGWFPSILTPNIWAWKSAPYSNEFLEDLLKFKVDEDGEELKTINLLFEAVFSKKYVGEGEKILYHVTPETNVKTILKSGIICKHGNKLANHPNRIYCIFKKTQTKKIAKLLADNYRARTQNKADFYDKDGNYNGHKSEPIKYSVFSIDYSKLPNIKWYTDPNYQGGVYTNDNIPPNEIKLIETIDV